MKLTNGIALFNKQANRVNKIHKNDILEKNSNFSVPIIDNENNNNDKNHKKIIERKEKEKVTLIKSFCNKNERNSRSKSNSNSKEYKKRYKSNNINNKLNQNVFINNTNNNSYNNYPESKKYIFGSYILTPLSGMKIYENTINKIFAYIKKILSKKLYIDIKKNFIKYIFEELHIKNNLLLSKTDSEIMNINLKLFYNKSTSVNRSNSKNSQNKKDFSFTRNYNNKTINNHNYNTAKNNFTKQYIFNGLLKNHNSLYSLNKRCVKIPGIPITFNLSKSPVKSKSKSGSKGKKLSKKNNKNYLSNNNIFDPDMHVFKILNQRKKNIGNNKNFNNTIKSDKVKKQLNSNLILNKKNKNILNKNKTSNTFIYSDKKNEILNNNKSIIRRENSNKSIIKKDEINDNINENNLNKNEKNDEQLKQIKSGLDENLKFLFNFSYENFLNKESESESKKSVIDYNNIEQRDNNNFNKNDVNNI